jgi:hypothetical protein
MDNEGGRYLDGRKKRIPGCYYQAPRHESIWEREVITPPILDISARYE